MGERDPARERHARKSVNRQSRSVGNLGDILKHAALVELACALSTSNHVVQFVDTHTFLLHAPLADAARWEREVAELVQRHPRYARYVELEREALRKTGLYRCSSGLVMDALGARRGHTTLGEVNGVTRAELREQAGAEQLAEVFVAESAASALHHARAMSTEERADALLVHIDPFALKPEDWLELEPALEALTDVCATAGSRMVLIVYRYTRSARSPWPRAPSGTVGPIADVRGGPHEVAAYASPELVELVEDLCTSLGWARSSAP